MFLLFPLCLLLPFRIHHFFYLFPSIPFYVILLYFSLFFLFSYFHPSSFLFSTSPLPCIISVSFSYSSLPFLLLILSPFFSLFFILLLPLSPSLPPPPITSFTFSHTSLPFPLPLLPPVYPFLTPFPVWQESRPRHPHAALGGPLN